MCEADGTTTLLTPEVEVRTDGLGLRVRSELDESASVNGLGMDVEPGITERVIGPPPGAIDVACWPFSQHRSDEPSTHRLIVRDPDGLYVSSELECPTGDTGAWSAIHDFIDTRHGRYDDPIEAARAYIEVRPDDELAFAGYPEQSGGRTVIVVRGGATVASVGVGKAEDGRWYIGGASGCGGVRSAF